jgi:site-specific DNA-methyltransferase (adenine-specific)
MRECIRRMGLPPRSWVVDPFLGSGSTSVAAVREGHRSLGFEVDPYYARVARRRIEAALARDGSIPGVVDRKEARP